MGHYQGIVWPMLPDYPSLIENAVNVAREQGINAANEYMDRLHYPPSTSIDGWIRKEIDTLIQVTLPEEAFTKIPVHPRAGQSIYGNPFGIDFPEVPAHLRTKALPEEPIYEERGQFFGRGEVKPLTTGTAEGDDDEHGNIFEDPIYGYEDMDEARAAAAAQGIVNPTFWMDNKQRIHVDIAETPKPTGTKIISTTVVGNETVYELENGTTIRQPIPTEAALDPTEGFDSEAEAIYRGLASGLERDQLETFILKNKWHFRRISDQPTEASSWFETTDPATGALILYDRTTGAVKPIGDVPAQEISAGIQQPQVIESEGYKFAFNPNTGAFSQLEEPAETFDPGFIDTDLGLFQQRTGAIQQFAKQDLDDIITQALVDGNYEKAFAFQDFQDRPTAADSLNFALAFARSPADQQIISEIARGASTVSQDPFDPTSPRRVGPQPQFLIDAYQDYNRRTYGGGLPGTTEATQLEGRLTEGLSPEAADEIARLRQELRNSNTEKKIENLNLRIKNVDEAVAATAAAASASAAREETQEYQDSGLTQSQLELIKTFDETQRKLEQTRLKEAAQIRGVPTPGSKRFDEAAAAAAAAQAIADADKVRQEQIETQHPVSMSFLDLGTEGKVPMDQQGISSVSPAQSTSFLDLDPEKRPVQPRKVTALGTDTKARQNWPYGHPMYQGMARGGTAKLGQLEIVGEEGAELVDLAPGSRVIPIAKLGKGKKSKKRIEALKKSLRARPMQAGGLVFGGTQNLPFGLRQLQAGGGIEPPRGYLLRAANLQLPSLQALNYLTPESVEIFKDQAALAGIPPAALEQELALTRPGGRRLAQGRFRPLQLGGIR